MPLSLPLILLTLSLTENTFFFGEPSHFWHHPPIDLHKTNAIAPPIRPRETPYSTMALFNTYRSSPRSRGTHHDRRAAALPPPCSDGGLGLLIRRILSPQRRQPSRDCCRWIHRRRRRQSCRALIWPRHFASPAYDSHPKSRYEPTKSTLFDDNKPSKSSKNLRSRKLFLTATKCHRWP